MSDHIEILVGKVGRAHGLKGDVAIEVRTDEPESRFAPGSSFSTSAGTLTVATATWHGRRLLVRFEQSLDRTAAERLRGIELRVDVPLDERPADPEEFYDHQLIGMTAHDPATAPLGEVTDVLHLPAQDVLVVRHDGRDVLVPFVAAMVPTVDLDQRRLVVVDEVGLFDADADADDAVDAEG